MALPEKTWHFLGPDGAERADIAYVGITGSPGNFKLCFQCEGSERAYLDSIQLCRKNLLLLDMEVQCVLSPGDILQLSFLAGGSRPALEHQHYWYGSEGPEWAQMFLGVRNS